MTSARVVTLYGRVLTFAGPLLTVAALAADPRWVGRWREIAVLGAAGVALRGASIPLSKYSYLTQTGVIALSGALLVGVPATIVALLVAVFGADWIWRHKPLGVAAVNAGREILALVAAFGVYASVLRAAGVTTPGFHVEMIPALFFLALGYFVVGRLLFYCTLLLRGKLEAVEELSILRYECLTYFATLVAAATVTVTVRVGPPVTWMFVGSALVGLGLLFKRFVEEAITAEERNKVHAMESVITSDMGLTDAFERIERLAHRLVDWNDFRIYRVVDGHAELAYRSAAGGAGRGEPSADTEALRTVVVRTGETVVIDDVSRDRRIADAPPTVQSMVLVPLRFGDRIVGTLELEHHKRHSYRRADVLMVTSLAGQLATAIHITELRRPLVETVARLGEQLATMTRTAAALREVTAAVAAATVEIRAGASAEVAEVRSGLEATAHLADLARRVSVDGVEAATVSAEASAVAERHRDQVRDALDRLVALKTFVGEASHQVQGLGRVGRRITGFIASIRELADMTDLVALNAAIEAARAGRYGKGFAAVASEVRRLAEQSAGAASEAGDLVEEVHRTVGDVVEQMRRGQVSVGGVEDLSAGALAALDGIVAATGAATTHARRIAASAEEQGTAFAGLRSRMDAVAGIAGKTQAEATDVASRADEATRGLAELERATRELEQVAAMLRDLTRSFAGVAQPV
ncbi:MAG TPA: methyl-accepting chemotaxis protein [Gemmatimonadales bacterium]|jgi:methyl-accepting chemotaxis protein|nr:methyl-accepting chemotaxis protein [Gemmatimonadales bacterium]